MVREEVPVGRTRSFFIRFGAPLILIGGIGAVLAGRRGIQLKQSVQLWADSLSKGSSPLAISIPLLPAYLDGSRIGSLDSVRLDRHEPRVVDSVRLVIDLSKHAAAGAAVSECTFELVSFDPGDFKNALTCASDTADLVPFGRIAFTQGPTAPLFVARSELACAPWTDQPNAACIRERVQRQVRRDMQRMRDQMQRKLP
jgi:hypothetical protein